jgi:hypothetical protein
MNHNENEIVGDILNVYFVRFVNVEHENLWYVIDEFEHFRLYLYVVVLFLVANHYLSNDAIDSLYNNLLKDIWKQRLLKSKEKR